MIFDMTKRKGGSGSVDYFQYARSLSGMFYIGYGSTYMFPFDTIEINAPLVSNQLTMLNTFFSTGAFSTASQKKRGVKKIVLNIGHIGLSTNSGAFCGALDLEEIEINADNSTNLLTDNIRNAFSYLPALKKITGIVFNADGVRWCYQTSANVIYFPTGSALEEIRFVPDSMSYNGTYWFAEHGKLSDESLASIANAMDASGSVNVTKAIQLHSTASDKLSTIMGTVSDGFFTLDPNGTTTLLDFITQTKGWTVT